jgi:hypothetical protein
LKHLDEEINRQRHAYFNRHADDPVTALCPPVPPAPTITPIEQTAPSDPLERGRQLLLGKGWRLGTALGKTDKPANAPVDPNPNLGRRGLGSDGPEPDWRYGDTFSVLEPDHSLIPIKFVPAARPEIKRLASPPPQSIPQKLVDPPKVPHLDMASSRIPGNVGAKHPAEKRAARVKYIHDFRPKPVLPDFPEKRKPNASTQPGPKKPKRASPRPRPPPPPLVHHPLYLPPPPESATGIFATLQNTPTRSLPPQTTPTPTPITVTIPSDPLPFTHTDEPIGPGHDIESQVVLPRDTSLDIQLVFIPPPSDPPASAPHEYIFPPRYAPYDAPLTSSRIFM